MSADWHASDREPQWVWNTRVTDEAARAALAKGQTPQERFELFEQIIAAACQERKSTERTRKYKLTADNTLIHRNTLYGNAAQAVRNLSDCAGYEANYLPPNDVKNIIVEKCLTLAGNALTSNWTFQRTIEALLWFRSVLKIDPKNTRAFLGSARAYQYIASQPWWYNDIRLARNAAAKALGMTEQIRATLSVVEARERELVNGQIYSAIGRCDLADRHFDKALDMNPEYSSGHYFKYFNRMFIKPRDDIILPGLEKAVELAEAEGGQRRVAAALYFRGFANTLFTNYDKAIKDLNKSMNLNPGYGSANLALIAATALARHKETYRVVRQFKERYPNFSVSILDYMWVDRSSCAEYHHLVRPLVEIVSAKVGH
jgi:tetratricopeptide (TPR) repeat protein